LGEKGERAERITSSNFLNNSGGKKKDEEEVFFEERRFGDRSCIFFLELAISSSCQNCLYQRGYNGSKVAYCFL